MGGGYQIRPITERRDHRQPFLTWRGNGDILSREITGVSKGKTEMLKLNKEPSAGTQGKTNCPGEHLRSRKKGSESSKKAGEEEKEKGENQRIMKRRVDAKEEENQVGPRRGRIEDREKEHSGRNDH